MFRVEATGLRSCVNYGNFSPFATYAFHQNKLLFVSGKFSGSVIFVGKANVPHYAQLYGKAC